MGQARSKGFWGQGTDAHCPTQLDRLRTQLLLGQLRTQHFCLPWKAFVSFDGMGLAKEGCILAGGEGVPTGQTAGEGFLAEGITGHGQQGVGRAAGRVGHQGDQNCPVKHRGSSLIDAVNT